MKKYAIVIICLEEENDTFMYLDENLDPQDYPTFYSLERANRMIDKTIQMNPNMLDRYDYRTVEQDFLPASKELQDLKNELADECLKSGTSIKGIEYLVNYYMESLDWSEQESLKYAIGLFQNGTIEQIRMLGKNGEEL